ncbi:MAG TPA: TldD/PmbA family protein [Thermoanaerobaculia bacterium]|nr:TldD/PmbA family protein [Thermoanaerobaculia bacterium]
MRESSERSRSRFVVTDGARVIDRMTCEGHLVCIDHRCLARPLDEPPAPETADAVDALLALQVPVSYASCDAIRVTTIDGIRGPERRLRTWSLTARVAHLQLGWSGSGLPEIERIGDEIRVLADALRRAKPLDAQTTPAVLSAQAAAVLLHESVGHLIEAGPARSSFVGQRIAAECITASDDATCDGAPGTYEYDDDNVRALGPTLAVREGVVVAELHSLATAARAHTLPTGNARAASVWQEPLPRVSNLVCAGGEADLDALVDRCGNGVYLHRVANGINNGARVQADVVLAERIERGRRTGELLTGGRIDESVSIALRVAELGHDPRFNGNAMCGKSGQLLFNVGTCAPSLRFASLRIAA